MGLQYKVVVAGNLLPGFDRAAVAQALGRLVRRDEMFVQQLLNGQPITIKTGVEKATAEKYVNALASVGVEARAEELLMYLELDKGVEQRVRSVDDPVTSSVIQPEAHDPQTASRLWNPTAAVNWSLVLSPAFGAYLQMKNWQALHEADRASSSRGWLGFSTAAFVACLALIPLVARGAAPSFLLGVIPLGTLLVWYWADGKTQIAFVKAELGNGYKRRSLSGPVFLGAIIVVVSNAIALFTVKDAPVAAQGTSQPQAALPQTKIDGPSSEKFDPTTAVAADQAVRLDEGYLTRPWSGNKADQFRDVTSISTLAFQHDPRLADPEARHAIDAWQAQFMMKERKPANVALYKGVDMVLLLLNQLGKVCGPADSRLQDDGNYLVYC